MSSLTEKKNNKFPNPIQFIQKQFDNLEIQSEQVARQIVRLIPAQCPFAREVRLFGRVMFRIPPLCKLNPLYEQLMTLRFRALCFLADQCGEDITIYCT
ncbi:Mo-dependent nitrogenase family protein [Stanieria sp. NIES-3757]|nr:Mo-dependent nitrogenase family protein [Stanieria sp. NIES-3757]